jgi:hypothetical protein
MESITRAHIAVTEVPDILAPEETTGQVSGGQGADEVAEYDYYPGHIQDK